MKIGSVPPPMALVETFISVPEETSAIGYEGAIALRGGISGGLGIEKWK